MKKIFLITLVFLSSFGFAQMTGPGDVAGTLVTAAIRPNSQLDNMATAYTNEVRGGLHNYQTWAELQAINSARLVQWMLATVADSAGIIYQYDGSEWLELEMAGGLDEAPADGKYYGRIDSGWKDIPSIDSSWVSINIDDKINFGTSFDDAKIYTIAGHSNDILYVYGKDVRLYSSDANGESGGQILVDKYTDNGQVTIKTRASEIKLHPDTSVEINTPNLYWENYSGNIINPTNLITKGYADATYVGGGDVDEIDPVFSSHLSNSITESDTTRWGSNVGEAPIDGVSYARRDGDWWGFDHVSDIMQSNITAPFYQFYNTDSPKDYMIGDCSTATTNIKNGGSCTMVIKYRNHENGVDFGLATLGNGPGGGSVGLYIGIDNAAGLDAEIGFDTRQGSFSTGVYQELNRWYSAALVWDASNFKAKLYLDGILKRTHQYTSGTFSNMTNNSFLASINTGVFNGNVDIESFQVFSDTLTDKEIYVMALNSDVVPRRVMDKLLIDMASDKRSDKWYGRNGKGLYSNIGADLMLEPNQKKKPTVDQIKLNPLSVPTGLTSDDAGTIVCDSTDNNKIKYWNGSAWIDL